MDLNSKDNTLTIKIKKGKKVPEVIKERKEQKEE